MQLLKVKEVAEILRVPVSSAYKMLHEGQIPYVLLNRATYRVSVEDLESYIKTRTRIAGDRG